MQPNIQASMCYDGRDFELVEEQTLVQLAGSFIVLWNLENGTKDYIQSPRQNGYAQVCAASNLGLIAATEYGLQPECHIYKMPQKRPIAAFNLQTTLRTSAMAFSRDGSYLLIVGGVPDFRLSIFDIKADKFLQIPETKLPFPYSKLRQASFNPRDKNQFCILSESQIHFYTLRNAFQQGDQAAMAQNDEDEGGFVLEDSSRLETSVFNAVDVPAPEDEPTVVFNSLKWDVYNRLHLCTNLRQVFQVAAPVGPDGMPHLEPGLELESVPHTTLLTQKHMIVSTDDGMITWYKTETPYEDKDGKLDPSAYIKFLEIDQEYNYADQLKADAKAPCSYMKYSRSHSTIMCGSQNGVIATLAVAAEPLDEEEEDEENQDEKVKKQIDTQLHFLGRFHTGPIVAIRELPESTQFATISDDHTLAIWETTTGQQVSNMQMMDVPVQMNVSADGKALFIGSLEGAFLIYDVTDRENPRLVKQMRFFEQTIPLNHIITSLDGKIVMVSSRESDHIFICSQQASENYTILGFVKMDGYILSMAFALHDGLFHACCILSNNLMQVARVPTVMQDNRMNAMPDEFTNKKCRKVDRGSNLMISSKLTSKLFVTGEDKYLKEYDIWPQDDFSSINWKSPPIQPNQEYINHGIATTCYDFSLELQKLCTGGKDGLVIVRDPNDIRRMKDYQVYNVVNGGVTVVNISNKMPFFYSAGNDGSVFVVGLDEGNEYPSEVKKMIVAQDDAIIQMKNLELKPVSEMMLFTDIMKEEFEKANQVRKETFKKDMMDKLGILQARLGELLRENEGVSEIEKLQREEFCIDTDREIHVKSQGSKWCTEIKEESEKKCLVLELLRERVVMKTWEKMDVQSKAVKSISTDTLLMNFALRKREPKEQKVMRFIFNQRILELTEKYNRIEKQIKECLAECEFSKVKEGYFMNRMVGKPEFMDNDAIALAAKEFADKEAEKKARKNADELAKQATNKQTEGSRKPVIKITKGKLGTKTRKAAGADTGAGQQMAARDIQGMEEIHWKVVQMEKTLEELRSLIQEDGGPIQAYNILYESFDLFTDKRKRSQIELLKECVFELKRDFNGEFDKFVNIKQEMLFQIKEKNEQIIELQQNLTLAEETEYPEANILEDPNHIFEVSPEEIGVVKYLTKAEREKEAEAERIRLEREALLKGDNVGMRGLKSMMGGTELTFKKEKNPLEQELEREDWMNKPEEEMSEDEKQRYKEFQQKEKDLLEKRKKAWDQALNKVKKEILEIHARFEEQLLNLYKKRLFYEARIYEQELYIIRLNVQLHEVNETRYNSGKYLQEAQEAEMELENKRAFLQNCSDQLQEYEQKIQSDKSIQTQKESIKAQCLREQLNFKQIIGFVENGKPQARFNVPLEQKTQMLSHIILLDPFKTIDDLQVKEKINELESAEIYDYERDKPGEVVRDQFEKIVHERHERIKINKSNETNNKRLKNLRDFIGYMENEAKEAGGKSEALDVRSRKCGARLEKMKFNFEVIIYLKQGQVEIPQLPVATDYKDAILVNKKVVLTENYEITRRGEEKVSAMQSIFKTNAVLKHVQYVSKRLRLEITDYTERAKDVQLYRVTKQTQEIIQGKHIKKDEEDKKRLENQITQLEQSCAKRIEAINKAKKKLRHEIKEKDSENRQLEEKARQLQQSVLSREQILELKSGKNQNNANDPVKKMKETAQLLKLRDIIKQQSEEVSFLEDELHRLRARTFPSFAHLQAKQDYPDDR